MYIFSLIITALLLFTTTVYANDGTDHKLVGIDPVVDCSVRPDVGGGSLIAWLLECTEGGDTWVRVHEPQGRGGPGNDVGRGNNDSNDNDNGNNGHDC